MNNAATIKKWNMHCFFSRFLHVKFLKSSLSWTLPCCISTLCSRVVYETSGLISSCKTAKTCICHGNQICTGKETLFLQHTGQDNYYKTWKLSLFQIFSQNSKNLSLTTISIDNQRPDNLNFYTPYKFLSFRLLQRQPDPVSAAQHSII